MSLFGICEYNQEYLTECCKKDRMVKEIEYLLDMSVENIHDLVRAGWTLQPPDEENTSLEMVVKKGKG